MIPRRMLYRQERRKILSKAKTRAMVRKMNEVSVMVYADYLWKKLVAITSGTEREV